MATVKFLLQSNSENAPIYTRLSISRGKIYYRKTGLLINPNEWSNPKGLPKQNNPLNKKLTSKLKKLEAFIIDKYNISNAEAEAITGDWLEFQINLFFGRISENQQSDLLTDAIQYIVDTAHTRENGKGGIGLSECRINSYKRLKELFNEFQSKKQYTLPQLDKKTFDEFKTWLLDNKKYSHTYSYKKLSDLKSVCKDARGRGIELAKDFDGIKTKQPSAYDDDMDVIVLTENEIELIEKVELTSEALINARKWLILSCYTGQRGNDLTERIRKEKFKTYGKDLVIRIIQEKGNKPVLIPVLPKVKEIYENGLPYPISIQKLNDYFKEIGKIAGIDTPTMGRKQEKGKRGVKKIRPKWQYIGTHTGRRTFATLHYGKIPTPVIMRVTGHSKESTFLTYINQSNHDFVDTFIDYYKTKELKEQKETQLTLIKKAN